MSTTRDDDAQEIQPRSRMRFEAIFASAWIGFGLLVLPGLIYWVGGLLLGPYGENLGVGTFYGDFFADLAEPSARAWAILLGPVVTIYLLRLIFSNQAATDEPRAPDPKPTPQPKREPAPKPKAGPRRVEPRVGAE